MFADEIVAWAWRCRHFFSHRRQRALVFTRFRIARLPCTEQKRGTFRKKAEDFGRKPRVLRRTLRVFIRLFRSVFALLAESIDAPPGERSLRLAKKPNRVCPA